MTDIKNHHNDHRLNKKTVQLVLTKDEHRRFVSAKKTLQAVSSNDLVIKLLDNANL